MGVIKVPSQIVTEYNAGYSLPYDLPIVFIYGFLCYFSHCLRHMSYY